MRKQKQLPVQLSSAAAAICDVATYNSYPKTHHLLIAYTLQDDEAILFAQAEAAVSAALAVLGRGGSV